MESSTRTNALELIRRTNAGIIVCPRGLKYEESDWRDKSLILVDDPRLAFCKIMRALFMEERPTGQVHPSAVVHPLASIHPSAYVGPFTYVGASEIGEGTVIYGHVYIYSNVRIGKNVTIHAHTVVGVDGFGYVRNERDELEWFPHIGGVIIEDGVEIHSHVNVDRSTLGDTIIGTGTKIDKYCHIGHNVSIGKHCFIAAHSMIGGSTKIGDYVSIWACVCLRNSIEVGSRATIGMGAVVTKDVPPETLVMGFPARPEAEYKRLLALLSQLGQQG